MKTARPDLAALAVVGLIVAGVVACSLARVPIPEFLPQLGLFIAGGGLGVALNTGAPAPAAAPAPLEVAPPAPPAVMRYAAALTPPAPAPRGSTVYNPDDTSTFPRIATHD